MIIVYIAIIVIAIIAAIGLAYFIQRRREYYDHPANDIAVMQEIDAYFKDPTLLLMATQQEMIDIYNANTFKTYYIYKNLDISNPQNFQILILIIYMMKKYNVEIGQDLYHRNVEDPTSSVEYIRVILEDTNKWITASNDIRKYGLKLFPTLDKYAFDGTGIDRKMRDIYLITVIAKYKNLKIFETINESELVSNGTVSPQTIKFKYYK